MTTPPHAPPADSDLAIDLEQIVLHRQGTQILRGVSFKVARGESVALLGPNGCGKTTLSRVLLGQLYPTAGRATVLGQTLGATNVRRLRQRIGIVNPTTDGGRDVHVTGAVVDASLSTTQAVCTGYFATVGLYDQLSDDQLSHARHMLDHVGLGHRKDHRFGVLSTGEQRRALIARALVHRPELLILDEPTSGLDLAGREAVLATVDTVLQQPEPPAVLLITHHVEELSPRTDRVCLMQQGQITHAGTPDAVITPENLSTTFGCRVTVRKLHGRFWLEVLPEAWLDLLTT